MVLTELVLSVLVLFGTGVLSGIGIVEICIDSIDGIDVFDIGSTAIGIESLTWIEMQLFSSIYFTFLSLLIARL
jgi:hypothetical protein